MILANNERSHTPNHAGRVGGFPPAHLWTPPAIAGAGGAHRMDSGTLTGTVDSPHTAAAPSSPTYAAGRA